MLKKFRPPTNLDNLMYKYRLLLSQRFIDAERDKLVEECIEALIEECVQLHTEIRMLREQLEKKLELKL